MVREHATQHLSPVLQRLETYLDSPIYDSFAMPLGLKGEEEFLFRRIKVEGYFGPTATIDRSESMEMRASTTIDRIRKIREEWKTGFCDGDYTDIIKRIKIILKERLKKPVGNPERNRLESQIKELESANNNITSKKNVGLQILRDQWSEADSQNNKELGWAEMAIGITSAYFEHFKDTHKETHDVEEEPFELRDNQLYYMLLLTLNKGKYEFGSLETEVRGVELPTGEGKTFAFNLTAGIMAIRGEQVQVIEPNYISAKEHAEQMGEFFFDYLSIQTGVALDIPEPEGVVEKTVVRPIGTIEQIKEKRGVRKSFMFGEFPKKLAFETSAPIPEKRLEELSGLDGRNTVWKQAIVFCDKSSLAFDYLEGRQIGSQLIQNVFGLPSLKNVTGMIAEADALMIDEAKNPFVLSNKVVGDAAWDLILGDIGLNKAINSLVGEKDLSPAEKRLIAQDTIFGIWNALVENPHLFEEGKGKDYAYAQGQINISTNAIEKTSQLIDFSLQTVFPSKKRRKRWIQNNYQVINSALYVFLGMKLGRDSLLHKNQPVLIDESGFPLEKHQLNSIFHIFLQLQDRWPDWKQQALAKKLTNPDEILSDIINQGCNEIDVSVETDRIFPHLLYKKFGKLRFSSGTLTPRAGSFFNIYQAETVKVSRHYPIAEIDTRLTNPSSLWLRCPDGGYAKAEFHLDHLFHQQVINRVNILRANRRIGLVVCADIEEARELKRLMPDPNIVLVSADEELKERGRLARETKNLHAGGIIITTQMAARDIDMSNFSDEVKEAGGPEVIGVGLPTNESTMWQMLQRTVRGDLPGSRILMLSKNHLKPIIQKYLFRSGSKNLHKLHIREFEDAWNNMLGDRNASTKLFRQCIQHLRKQDEEQDRSIVYSEIRDGNLETWKKAMVDKWKRTNKTNEEITLRWSSFLQEIEIVFSTFILNPRISNSLANKKYSDVKNLWENYVFSEISKRTGTY